MTRSTNTGPSSEDMRARTLQAMAKATSDPNAVWGDRQGEAKEAEPAKSSKRRDRAPKPETKPKETTPSKTSSRRTSPLAIIGGVVAVIAVIVGSAVMLNGTAQTGEDSNRATVPDSSVDSSTPVSEGNPTLRPIVDAAQAVLGAGFSVDKADDVDPESAPPPGAGCGPSQSGVAATSSYQRNWTFKDASETDVGKLVIRVSEFDDPEALAEDTEAEQALASLTCAIDALEAQLPGIDVELGNPIMLGFGDGGAGYRLLSKAGGNTAMVTDVLIVSRGRIQATVTASRCCEGFGKDNEQTLVAALLSEMAEVQDLPNDQATADAADGPYMAEGDNPCRLLTSQDLALAGLPNAAEPPGIIHSGKAASSCRWTSGAVTVVVTSPGPESIAIPTSFGESIRVDGATAGFQPETDGGTINVRVGEKVFTITITGSDTVTGRDMAQFLAGIAAPRTADVPG